MNKFKLEKIRALQAEIMKLINEDFDPLFNIIRQIKNKDYNLKTVGYLEKHKICGLDLNMKREVALRRSILLNGDENILKMRCSLWTPEYLNNKFLITDREFNKYCIEKYFKVWVKI